MSVPTIGWMVPFVRVSADYWVDGTLRQGQCRLLGGWYHSSGSVLTIGWMVLLWNNTPPAEVSTQC